MQRLARLVVLCLLALTVAINAQQTRKPLTTAEYGQFETLAPVVGGGRGGSPDLSRGGLSPDGKWLAYGINRTNRNNELRITNIADGTTKTAAFGAQPAFSFDKRWVAYSIGYSEDQEEKLRRERKPIHRKLGLMNLGSGEQTTIEGIESFAFSPTGSHLAMRRYAPEQRREGGEAPAATDAEETPAPGATLIVRNLADARDMTFGSVAEYAWQDLPGRGRLLAMTISTEDKTGNGVQLFNAETGALRVLDSSASAYSGIAWRKDSSDLAVLRSKTDAQHDGPTHLALSFVRLGETAEARLVYDPTADRAFPAGMRTVTFRKPSWSEDGRIVFLGIAKWTEKMGRPEPTPNEDAAEPAGVDIWHSLDVDVIPKQKISARNDRQRNMLAALHVENGRFVQLAKDLNEQVTPIKHTQLALATNWASYAMDRSIGRPSADVSLVDLATGNRTLVKERLNDDRYVQASPGGKYILYVQDNHYWTINIATRSVMNVTRNVPTSFIDLESDDTIKQKPAFGVAGWTRNDAAVILYDKLDLWRVVPDGSGATKLTDGTNGEIRHRYTRIDPEEEFIDADKPLYVSLFGIWSKKAGYGRLRPGAQGEDHLVMLDKTVQRLAKAHEADVFAYTVEAFEDSPDIFTSSADLRDARQITKTNTFQANYQWGRAEIVEYKSDRGQPLQGALFYPANYEAGKKYPMVVRLYELQSDTVHRYSAPSEREYYNPSAFTHHGYFFFQPDIVFRPREPGLSVVECVTPAVKRVVEMGLVDARKVGVIGHSWGGFDTSFLATHSDVFTAAVAGAPITNLISNYGGHHWSSGIAETDHIETGQQRMEVPLWEDLQAYIRNSAVFNAQNMKTALMLMTGDADGTVFWHQSVELYNIARRAKKENVVMLVYAGEDHGLRKRQNQMDYQRRIMQWFGHYLKDEPKPDWIARGKTVLERDQELKDMKTRKPGSSQ